MSEGQAGGADVGFAPGSPEKLATVAGQYGTAAANPVLAELLGSLADRSAVLARRSVFLPGRAEQGLILHAGVIAAMNRGNADGAEQLKRQNLRHARDYLVRYAEIVR